MDINDLHAVRDGKSIRRHRAYNPYIHLFPNSPMMRLLFSITRPDGVNVKIVKPPMKAVKPKIVRAAKPAGSMVSYAKERRSL